MSQQINLYNPIFLKQKKIFSSKTMLEALGVLLLGLVAFYGYARYQVTTLQTESERSAKRLDAAQTRFGRLSQQFGPKQKSADIEAQIRQTEAELKTLDEVQVALNKGVLGGGSGFSPYLIAFARQSVSGLWLTGFSITAADMAISGRSLKPELVPTYIHRLGEEPVMQGRKFAMLEMRQPVSAGAAATADQKESKPANLPYVEFTLQSTVEKAQP